MQVKSYRLTAAESSAEQEFVLTAAFSAPFGAESEPPDEFLYMPAGLHTIHAGSDQGPVSTTVLITKETADALERSRASWAGKGEKPYFDFDHEQKRSSGEPGSFSWKEGFGVVVKSAWSGSGKDALKNKDYREFSPEFRVDKLIGTAHSPARVIGAPRCMGSLVNNRAFKALPPLVASEQKLKSMETPTQTPAAPATVTAAQPNLQAPAPGEAIDWKARATAAEANLKAHNKELARNAIKAAQSRGVFPLQPAAESEDAKIMARWEAAIEADPSFATLLARQGTEGPSQGGFITAGTPREEGTIRAAVTRPSLDNVLRAMDAAGGNKPQFVTELERYGQRWTGAGAALSAIRAEERAAIYARDVRPLFAKPDSAMEVIRAAERFDQQPDGGTIRAANALGTLSGILVVQRCLDLMKWELPELSRITSDFSAEPVSFNQTIDTRLRTVPAISDYNAVTGYADSDVTDLDVAITINKHKAAQIVYTANDLASTKRLLFPEQEEGMHYGLGFQMVSDVLGLVTPANYPGATQQLYPGAVVPSGTNASYDQMKRSVVIALKTALNLRQITGGTRTLLINSLYHGALENDTTIVGNLINPGSGDSIARGTLPPIAGFTPIEVPFFPANGGNLVGAALRADALAIAARLPNDYSKVFPGVTGGGVVETVTNPDTKFSVMLVMFLDHKLGQTRMRIAVMYGVAVGNPFALQYLVGQAAAQVAGNNPPEV